MLNITVVGAVVSAVPAAVGTEDVATKKASAATFEGPVGQHGGNGRGGHGGQGCGYGQGQGCGQGCGHGQGHGGGQQCCVATS